MEMLMFYENVGALPKWHHIKFRRSIQRDMQKITAIQDDCLLTVWPGKTSQWLLLLCSRWWHSLSLPTRANATAFRPAFMCGVLPVLARPGRTGQIFVFHSIVRVLLKCGALLKITETGHLLLCGFVIHTSKLAASVCKVCMRQAATRLKDKRQADKRCVKRPSLHHNYIFLALASPHHWPMTMLMTIEMTALGYVVWKMHWYYGWKSHTEANFAHASGQLRAKPAGFCKHAARTIIWIKKWRHH